MKSKLLFFLMYIQLSLLLFNCTQIGSEEENPIAPEGYAYIRFINLTNTNTRFYVDDVVNVNGDTAVYNFKGELYTRITTDYTGAPLVSGSTDIGFFDIELPLDIIDFTQNIDLKGQNTSGVYSWGNVGLNYFPNVTHRIPVAPIVNNISYHKWARVPAGVRTLSFRPSRNKVINFQPSVELLPESYRAPHRFEEGKYYTLLFAPVRKSSNDIERPTVITLTETPEEYSFEDSSTYIRFVNFTSPTDDNEQFNVRTASMDVYYVKSKLDTSIQAYVPVSEELLVQKNLRRFAADELNLNFFKIDMRDILKEASLADSNLINYRYTFLFYKAGDSKALNRDAVAIIEVDMRYSITNGLYNVRSWESNVSPVDFEPLLLLSRDPRKYQTTISTIFFNVIDNFKGFRLGRRLYKPIGTVTYHLERTDAINSYLQ